MRNIAVIIGLAMLAGCVVHREDTDSWIGVPVAELDKQPFFLTLPQVRTQAADGTEIRNYVNGQNVASCFGSGFATGTGGYVSSATYNEFTDCTQRFAACNNIFYIKNGVVTQYTPIGSGGMRCFTDASVRPGYRPTGF